MVFDTTATNTGHKTAGCVTIQEMLERPLLWFACRHHIGEVLLKHTWDALNIEVAKKTEITMFERFKRNFDNLTHSDIAELDYPCNENNELADKKASITELCEALLKLTFVRGDYKELVQLVMLYLSDDRGKNFGSFNRPGLPRGLSQSTLDGKVAVLNQDGVTCKQDLG